MYTFPFEESIKGMKSFSSCDINNESINLKLSMRKNSQNRTKSKPKIRIIHIIAPEIIKTDVENFRDLVQRLTGRKRHVDDGDGNDESLQERTKMTMMMMSGYDQMKVEKEDDEQIVYGGGFGMDGFVEGFGELPVFPLKRPNPQLNAFLGEMPLFYVGN